MFQGQFLKSGVIKPFQPLRDKSKVIFSSNIYILALLYPGFPWRVQMNVSFYVALVLFSLFPADTHFGTLHAKNMDNDVT